MRDSGETDRKLSKLSYMIIFIDVLKAILT